MHADIHHVLHTARAAELHARAAESRLPRTTLRTRIGWTLIEVGLRLTARGPSAATAVRTA
ncbi:hypothetical protein [Streptomyces sp. NPDC049916]|uniref:hypothetical protein n=1 Tax=Streptomyces sp. NPDC049916 TaxID=3155156 RepID=UPI00342F3AF1